ncbi:MAG TPA: phosphatidylinositol-specific phospholipase C [Chitinophaga sp.]|uniref:phosphatidylinositol-specific phospholipase C n=1 Tax=Chitinophaga sp. TaxID=1869181 RepID=UPI002DBB7D9D|nr:phosphatidylinositol-specific phospholipase C [Chitinophaga sp.]HEU4555823.1 phosphatidylinositol-specific phospholipase C [Chitinophaga sp.]
MKKQTFIAVIAVAVMLLMFGCTRALPIYETQPAADLLFQHAASFEATTTAYPARIPLSNWMEMVPGNVNLTSLSLPGAHNACARYERIGKTAKCQTLSISGQLNAGIRFLDIRCRHIDNTFLIHHGMVYQRLDFDSVMHACIAFLDRHPGECIIMSIKEEYTPAGNTRTFEATFDAYARRYANRWYLQPEVPALEEARGKIVLLRRFAAQHGNKGIDATAWARNRTFTITNGPTPLRIQDEYRVPRNRVKWSNSTALLTEASAVHKEALYINFLSGYKPRTLLRIPNIKKVSMAMGKHIVRFFTANQRGRFGIIAMDFADAAKASLIIGTNFQEARQSSATPVYVLNNNE